MPLPFILAGAAIASAGFGVKKGFDAKEDMDDAKDYNTRAESMVKKFSSRFESQKKKTSNSLDNYGNSKKAGLNTIDSFRALFVVTDNAEAEMAIRINLKENKRIVITEKEEIEILKSIGVIDKSLSIDIAKNKIETDNVEMETISEGLKSIATGSLAGVAAGGGAYLGVGTLATASTGTAISGLSGAAATNATLAWLGGGSLATGGFGIAGGTAVLGGLVAGPFLAIGGAVFAYKAAEAKDQAYSQYKKVQGEIKKGEVVVSKLHAIQSHTDECNSVFKSMKTNLEYSLIPQLKEYANSATHYKDMDSEGKMCVMASYAIAYILKDFIKEGTMNANGDNVNPNGIKLLKSEKVKEYS